MIIGVSIIYQDRILSCCGCGSTADMPLTRYAKSRAAHAPGMPKRFPGHPLQRKPLVCDPGMHHGTCVTHVGIASPRVCGKRSRHPRRMRNPQFYVSGKRPMLTVMNRAASYARNMIMRNQHNWKRCKLIYSSNLQTCWSRYCFNTICFSALENIRWPCHCWCSLERSWYLLGSQVYLLNRMS